MDDPAIRQQIIDGIRTASGQAVELQMMMAAWKAARPGGRKTLCNSDNARQCPIGSSCSTDFSP
jgi:hypothetical protein